MRRSVKIKAIGKSFDPYPHTSNEFKTMFYSKLKPQKISLHIRSPARNANQLLIEFINRLLRKITVTDSYNYQLVRCYIPEISGSNLLLSVWRGSRLSYRINTAFPRYSVQFFAACNNFTKI